MKKAVTAAAFATFMITGCSDKEEVSNPPKEAPVEKEQSTGSKDNGKKAFVFTGFDLDVDYKGMNNSYEVSYDNEKEGMEAEIDDQLKNKKMQGQKAYDELSKKFKEMKFTHETPEKEVIQEVAKVFNLKNDYNKLELDVTYEDGTEKEYIAQN